MRSTIEYKDGYGDTPRVKEHHETMLLKPWQEVVGNLELTSLEENSFIVQLGTRAVPIRLAFGRSSPEGNQIREFLAKCSPGCRIGFLRTDLDSTPILLRRIRD